MAPNFFIFFVSAPTSSVPLQTLPPAGRPPSAVPWFPEVGAIDVLMGMHEAAVSHKGRGAPPDILSSRGMV